MRDRVHLRQGGGGQVERRRSVRSAWVFALIFLPIETWVSWSNDGSPIALYDVSGYVVNIAGVVIMLWGAVSLRRGRAYADGLIAAGWGWTTAVFWRATNLRYMLADAGEPPTFGSTELWLAPVATIVVAVLFVRSLITLVQESYPLKERPVSGRD